MVSLAYWHRQSVELPWSVWLKGMDSLLSCHGQGKKHLENDFFVGQGKMGNILICIRNLGRTRKSCKFESSH